jgi:hypothetical protein
MRDGGTWRHERGMEVREQNRLSRTVQRLQPAAVEG